jgi:ribosomal protein L22
MAKKPETPSQGKPFEQEQAADQAAEGAQQLAQQEAELAAADAPAPETAEKGEPQAEGTAAAVTGVDKAAADAVADKETSTKGAAKDAEATQGKAKASPKKDEEPKTKGKGKAATKAKADTPAKPASGTRRRDRREPAEAVVVRAHAKYVRSSARKARLVCDQIRGKSVPEARALLAFSPRDVAEAWTKLLDSAVANAEHNHDLVGEDLKIHAVFADEGPTIKRFRPRAMGRATSIRKRTSHLTIQLTPKETR